MARIYNDPAGGNQSSIGDVQFNEFLWQKTSLIELAKETMFGQMADTFSMPKHMGKTIKKYHYLPMLDDANINSEGIDAAGVTTTRAATIIVSLPNVAGVAGGITSPNLQKFFKGESSTDALATTAAKLAFNEWVARAVSAGGLGGVLTTPVSTAADYTTHTTTGGTYTTGQSAYDSGYRNTNDADGDAVARHGNLYGSSKDVGTISSKLPVLTENGGRVNRVGFSRVELEGSIAKFGFFEEYTKESLDFDSDAQLGQHVTREMLRGAHQMTEAALQIDLLNSPGVIRFGGDAIATNQLTGNNGATASLATYDDLSRLSIILDNNRVPKDTKIITGSKMTDTKTINSARYLFIGSELIPTIEKMVDNFGNAAFVSAEKYAGQTKLANGEIGSIGRFRIVVAPEMLHWEGAGAAVTTNDGYRETGGNYDVFPMLFVGSGSFTTVGFQTDGQNVKFKIKHVKPESDAAYSRESDPFGEMGFSSIKWYYGSMILRPERIAIVKVVAEW